MTRVEVFDNFPTELMPDGTTIYVRRVSRSGSGLFTYDARERAWQRADGKARVTISVDDQAYTQEQR